ncbi:MAG: hemH [Rickettsiaceae bacterium]|jgi:ferrochelatase|nr:hemH [Rickettsiaceae bacterium]
MKKTAVILFNLGGPDSLESVKGFLFNLFNDKAIIDLRQPFRYLLAHLISSIRNKKAQKIYAAIGGKSPILEITNAQAEALEKELSFFGDYKVFVSMRYSRPNSSDVIKKIKEYGADEIILLPLYPQFSTTTSGSSINDFYQKLKKGKVKTVTKYICCYPINSDFISAHCRLIKQSIEQIRNAGFNNFRLLFSAHGLPKKIVDAGDPYCFQVKSSTEAIIKELGENFDYKICYQSKVGPMEWTGPSLEFEVKRAALDGKAVIIVPITFVSDHSETLFELDIQFKEFAAAHKVPFYSRVAALNLDGYFIKSLANICQKTSQSDEACAGGDNGNRICPKNFKKCININGN